MNKFILKKKMFTITIVLFTLLLSIVGAKFNIIERASAVFHQEMFSGKEDLHEYNIEGDFDPVEKIFTGIEKITYTNEENRAFNSLYFHVYPNAFKKEETVPFDKSEMSLAYPEGFEPGSIQIDAVKGNKDPLNYTIIGMQESILKVNLNKELEPGEKIDLEIEFFVKIPPSCGRFGYGENTVNMGNWYPILSVFDSQGWHLDPYYAIGDPFYSDMANYRVSLSMPKEYTLASSGNLIKKENIHGKVYWTIEGKSIRDFAIIISDEFKVMEDEIEGIKIYSYYFQDPFGELALQTGKDAIKIFSEMFGKYPYKQITVAASDFFIGGMEYPNIVFIDETLYEESRKEILEYVIAHEVAHQWWYGIVGNNEVGEPWLDEALTEYSTLLYYEKKYGKDMKNKIFKDMIVRYYNAYRDSSSEGEGGVYRSIGKFKDSREYQALVYYKGAMFVQDLRKELGDDVFFQVMKVYFDKYKYKNANTENFIKVCEEVSNMDLRENFRTWLNYEKE